MSYPKPDHRSVAKRPSGFGANARVDLGLRPGYELDQTSVLD